MQNDTINQDLIKLIEPLKERFEGITFVGQAVCHHTIGPFLFLKNYFDVKVYAERVTNYRSLNVDTKDLKIESLSQDILSKIIAESRNRLVFTWGGVRPESHSNLTYYLSLSLRNSGCFVVPINQEWFSQYDGLAGLLRKLKWFLNFNFGEAKNVRLMGVTGKSGLSCYKKIFAPKLRLFDFIYTPYCDNPVTPPVCTANKVRFLIIGQLIPRKYILETIEAFYGFSPKDAKLSIVGQGALENEIKELIKDVPCAEFLGFKSREEVDALMAEQDYILLPSIFDGWGCTTNEALLHGCKVIASDGAGSHSLIAGRPNLGTVFKRKDFDSYRHIIGKAIKDGPLSLEQREGIIKWAERISPQRAAIYLIQQINYYLNLSKTMPTAPWEE